ncbi:TPT-domain-containing protein [Venturia nashicola]|uniref:TPT-domain-containing protein n=1 Tax=Venturia nashicola TaxID=86259 RepID=A0A4Z1NR98_9PEZI|nr:TPT-domain-containing protein [Venturia nashicola]TLD18707.1 TPT-domain-containing protein [Venturia nashicola]
MTDHLLRCSTDTPQEWIHSSTNSEGDETLLDDEMSYQNLHKVEDIESQPVFDPEFKEKPIASPLAAEYTIPIQKKLIYLSVYFGLNLGLTLYNKALLGNFHFPWLLTAFHAASASLGCFALEARGYVKQTKLRSSDTLVLIAFSFLFTINIAISNVSLAMVSVPFHQIMRSTTPVFALLIHRIMFSRSYSTSTYLSLVPLVMGVGLCTYGDYYFTPIGFMYTLAGTVLAATKTIATNRLMTGSLALPALEILLRMSPLAALQSLLLAYYTGELCAFSQWIEAGHLTNFMLVALIGNGMIAFLLNVSSFQTNKLAGALTITVCGNLKQCLTIICGIVLFNVKVGPLNALGMVFALAGAAWYSKVELKKKTQG